MKPLPLRVLCIEDSTDDAELVEAHLGLHGFQVELMRVDDGAALREVLSHGSWDIALADYSLPTFSAQKALEIIKGLGSDLPVIIVSGTIGENRAVEMMRAGASDFIVKGDFGRLVPAIRRELAEAMNRRARKEAEKALDVSEGRFHSLADSMPHLVSILNPEGELNFINQRWLSVTGLSEDRLTGHGWKGCLYPPEIALSFEKAFREQRDFSLEHQLKIADGDLRWFLTQATPSRNSQDEVIAWYASTIDIHQQKLVAEELRQAKRLAEQASEAKSIFLANMSHELRTPLGAVLGFASLLDEPGQTQEERADYVERIRRNGVLLSKVINEILDLSKVEAGRLEIESIEFDLQEVLQDIRNLLALKAEEKGLLSEYVQEGELPKKLVSDPTRLRQILINLISNAVKFTEEGQVVLTVRGQLIDGPSAEFDLTFEVKDTGIGISPEQSQQLFQAFVQADASVTRKFGGAGLGLHLARRMAQALGGDVILLRSEAGAGSTFQCRVRAQTRPLPGVFSSSQVDP